MRYGQRERAQFRLEPNILIETRKPDGEWITRIKARNLIVITGIELVRDLIGGTGHRPSHIGLGTGVTPVLATDTTIETEAFRGLITTRNDLAAAIEFQLFLGLSDGNGFTYTEAGILETGFQNGSVNDPAILFARSIFTGITKTISIELTITWTITIVAV